MCYASAMLRAVVVVAVTLLGCGTSSVSRAPARPTPATAPTPVETQQIPVPCLEVADADDPALKLVTSRKLGIRATVTANAELQCEEQRLGLIAKLPDAATLVFARLASVQADDSAASLLDFTRGLVKGMLQQEAIELLHHEAGTAVTTSFGDDKRLAHCFALDVIAKKQPAVHVACATGATLAEGGMLAMVAVVTTPRTEYEAHQPELWEAMEIFGTTWELLDADAGTMLTHGGWCLPTATAADSARLMRRGPNLTLLPALDRLHPLDVARSDRGVPRRVHAYTYRVNARRHRLGADYILVDYRRPSDLVRGPGQQREALEKEIRHRARVAGWTPESIEWTHHGACPALQAEGHVTVTAGKQRVLTIVLQTSPDEVLEIMCVHAAKNGKHMVRACKQLAEGLRRVEAEPSL